MINMRSCPCHQGDLTIERALYLLAMYVDLEAQVQFLGSKKIILSTLDLCGGCGQEVSFTLTGSGEEYARLVRVARDAHLLTTASDAESALTEMAKRQTEDETFDLRADLSPLIVRQGGMNELAGSLAVVHDIGPMWFDHLRGNVEMPRPDRLALIHTLLNGHTARPKRRRA